MQYNKYAIALVLLASSAFASSSVSTDVQAFAEEIATFMSNKSKADEISDLTPKHGTLSEGLLTKLKTMDFENIKNSADVKDVLEKYVAEEAEAAKRQPEKEANSVEVEAEKIFESMKDGKLSNVEDENLGNLKDKKAEITNYETDILYRPFTKDDIVKRLLNPSYLPEKFANASQKLKFLANDGNISTIDIDKHPNLITSPQFQTVNAVETALERSLTEAELNAYLTNKNFKALDVAEKVKVLKKLSGSGKVGAYEKISEFVDEVQLNSINAEEKTETISSEKLAEILNPKANPTNETNSNQETTPNTGDADKPKETEKPKEETDAKIKEAEAAKIKEAEAAKTKEAEAAKTKEAEAAKTIEAGAKADKVLEVLKDKKFSELSKKEIDALDLTAAEIAALKKENVTKDSKISEILVNVKEPVDSSSSTAEVADTPFYKTTWFISISAVLVLGAIGGGTYIMTRKTEETDL